MKRIFHFETKLTYLSLHKHATIIHNNIATQIQASAIPIHSPGKQVDKLTGRSTFECKIFLKKKLGFCDSTDFY